MQSEILFENELFSAANKLRGTIPPSEYKYYVLPLIFIKFISNKEIDIPLEAKWSFLQTCAENKDILIKQKLDTAMEQLENHLPNIKGALPKIYSSSSLGNEAIFELVNLFSKEIFNEESDRSVDILGRVYEYFIGNFATTEGNRGGEFFTPSSIVNLLVRMLEPKEGIVFDPACGSGGMFVQSDNYTLHKNSLKFFGQEQIDTTIRLAKLNAYLHDIDVEIRKGNSLLEDQFSELKADFIISNPPFNMKEWGAAQISPNDPRLIGTVTDNNANYMWIQHFLYHLKEGGLAGFVIANGALTSNNSIEKDIREKLLLGNFIDCVVQLPEKMFSNTGIPSALIFLSKNRTGTNLYRNRINEVLFINASHFGKLISRKQRVFSEGDIEEIASVYHSYKLDLNDYTDKVGFCKIAKIEDILEKGLQITPGLYVGQEAGATSSVKFDQKIAELKETLSRQFEESDKLQQRIIKNLEELL